MKKTRGKRGKASSHKSSKKHSSFFKKYFPVILVAAVLLTIVILFSVTNSTGNVVTGNAETVLPNGAHGTDTTDILSNSVPNWGESVVNFFNTGAPTDAVKIGTTWKDLIIVIVVFVIILAGMFDILTLTSIFDNAWVIWIMSVGLAIIASLTGVIRNVTTFLIQVAAGFGAIGIAVEIIISIVIFIGLSIGGTFFAKWAAKRKAQKEMVKSIKGAGSAAAAITGLKDIQKALRKGE
jgi:hypothetical protein